LLGGGAIIANVINQRGAVAEPQTPVDVSVHIGRVIKPCCHLGPEEYKQVIFIFYDSRNALQKEFMSEVEAR
jgi:hypothetical protein